mmetsp:Transcript_6024/g.8785  ORF Transcript_6024/g.8785 Transcript_6024/m.8785 type:complete len:237 (+) Transcript_6024:2-712(+)
MVSLYDPSSKQKLQVNSVGSPAHITFHASEIQIAVQSGSLSYNSPRLHSTPKRSAEHGLFSSGSVSGQVGGVPSHASVHLPNIQVAAQSGSPSYSSPRLHIIPLRSSEHDSPATGCVSGQCAVSQIIFHSLDIQDAAQYGSPLYNSPRLHSTPSRSLEHGIFSLGSVSGQVGGAASQITFHSLNIQDAVQFESPSYTSPRLHSTFSKSSEHESPGIGSVSGQEEAPAMTATGPHPQ